MSDRWLYLRYNTHIAAQPRQKPHHNNFLHSYICLLGTGDAIPLYLTCRISVLYDNGCFCAQKHKFPPSKNSSFSVIAFALAVFSRCLLCDEYRCRNMPYILNYYIIYGFLLHIPMLIASRIYAVLQPEYPLLSQGVFRCGAQSIGI